jgi:Ca-activated chloride channel family protein
MSELIQKVEHPALTNITLQWPQGVQAEMAPANIGDLYSGEPLVITARMPSETRGVLQISGTSSGPWTRQLPLGPGESRQGISTLWARNKIADLMDQQVRGSSDDDTRAQVLPLALSYGLVTQYTSLVAIDRSPARPADQTLESQRVPNAKPQGSEWSTVAYPKTATPAQLQLLIGALAIALALAMIPFHRRWR